MQPDGIDVQRIRDIAEQCRGLCSDPVNQRLFRQEQADHPQARLVARCIQPFMEQPANLEPVIVVRVHRLHDAHQYGVIRQRRRRQPRVQAELLTDFIPRPIRRRLAEHHLDRPACHELRTATLDNVHLIVKAGTKRQR